MAVEPRAGKSTKGGKSIEKPLKKAARSSQRPSLQEAVEYVFAVHGGVLRELEKH